jgi:hypothetical protein
MVKGDWHNCVALGSPAVKPLIAALKDENSDVRKAAADALVKIGAPAVEPLIAALKDENSDVRQAAAKALGKIGDPRAVEPLIAALKDKDVRKAAAEALGRLGWEPAQDEMAGWYWMAKRDWDKCVALGALAVEPLIAALKDAEWMCAKPPPKRWEKSAMPTLWSRSSLHSVMKEAMCARPPPKRWARSAMPAP